MRACGCFAAGRKGVGVGGLQSRGRGAGEGYRQQDGGEYEFCGTGGASLWSGFCGGGFFGEASGVWVEKAAVKGYEGGALGCVCGGAEGWGVGRGVGLAGSREEFRAGFALRGTGGARRHMSR